MIDQSRLQELRNEIGADVLNDVILLFLEESKFELTELTQERFTPEEVSDRLQFISGSATNLGLLELAQLCIAARLRAHNGEPLPLCPHDLKRTFAQAREAYQEAALGLKSPVWEK